MTRATLYSNGREFREIKLWWPKRLFDGDIFIGEPEEESRESEDGTDDSEDDDDDYAVTVADNAPTCFDSYDHSNFEEIQSEPESSATSNNAEPEEQDSAIVEATRAEKIKRLKAKYPTVEKVLVSLHKNNDERVLNQQSDMLPSIGGVLQKKLAAEDEITLMRVPWQLLNR